MFVKNFYIREAVRHFGDKQNDGEYARGFSSAYKATDDVYIGWGTSVQSYLNLNYCTESAGRIGEGVSFGDGDTPVTFSDINLSGNRIAGLSVVTKWAYSMAGENGSTITATYTITNNNSEAVTIREVALFSRVPYASSSNTAYFIMVDRTVLDSPVTIEPNGMGQVNYTINLNYPTA